MKQAKKLLALVMVLAMVMSLGITAFAAETEEVKKDIIFPKNDNHMYEIYQVFVGDLETPDGESKEVMVNIKYGKNTAKEGAEVEESVLDSLVAENANVKSIVEGIVTYSNPVATRQAGVETVSVPVGYYVIKDMGLNGSEEMPLSEFIVGVVGDLTITPKRSGTPTAEKKLKDTNDSDGSWTDWVDSADHDFNDEVPFKIEITLPAGIESFEKYEMIVHDVQSAGLDTPYGFVVTNITTNKKLTADSDYSIDLAPEHTDAVKGKCTFEVNFPDANKFGHEGDVITIEYFAKLNEDAVIGTPGNPNDMQLEYSNKSETGEITKEKTPWDTVIVFTYKTIINKVKEDETTPLDGATFELYKKYATDGDVEWRSIKVVKVEGNDHTFNFEGLDDGDYLLKETEAPAGYNPIKDVYFTITAVHTDDNTTNPLKLTSLSGGVTADTDSGEITLTAGKDESQELNGELSANVVNKKGVELPSTGGIGTTIFYVVGSMMMLAAAVLLITRKKMSAYQD